jgi:hypothetical protein
MRIYTASVEGRDVSTTQWNAGGWRSIAFDLTQVEGQVVTGDICLDTRRSAGRRLVVGDAVADDAFASMLCSVGAESPSTRLSLDAHGVDVLNSCVGGYLQLDVWIGDTPTPQPYHHNHRMALELRAVRAVAASRAA